jgi:ribose 5-phosphate isomerase RpiB
VKYGVPVTEMIDKFTKTSYSGDERHRRRIGKIMEIENQN